MTARPYDHPDNVLPGGQPRMAENEWAISERLRELEVALSGSAAAPLNLTAGASIPVGEGMRQLKFVKGNGGPVVVTANPRIAAGSVVGQECVLKGTSDADYVTLLTGQGVELKGTCVLKAGSVLTVLWDGVVWGEVSRNDI